MVLIYPVCRKTGTTPVFGDWLKSERLKRGWSQQRLGDEVDLSKAQISRLESGDQSTKRPTVTRVAEKLNADVDEALLSAGFAPTPGIPELTRELDSDTAEMIHFYEGLSPSSRSISKTMIQQLREVERAASIGGGLPPETEKE